MRFTFVLALLAGAAGVTLYSCGGTTPKDSVETGNVAKTSFQSSRSWDPSIDTRADAVMVYGVGGNPSDHSSKWSFEKRAESWRGRGYLTYFMTGIAWGAYKDYFTGEWDGRAHLDEGQVRENGDTIWHGHMVPYIVPTANFLKYFKECHVKRAIDAGVSSIFFEEPEFWNNGGYSEAFKKEWKAYYGTPWRPQHESPEATYLSNKLKYHLYYKAIEEASDYAKEYGAAKGVDVKCYVATHSLLNYSQWRIVSPEASLASLPGIDGYIGQIWTGTSRAPNYFNGRKEERTFETAYLEYQCVGSMTAPTNRTVWFLTDPIEDWPRDWEDYRRNYHATYAAQLLYPKVANYEIMPWPERIYQGLYNKDASSDEKIRIPKDYSTMMQVMTGALQNMPVSDNKVSGSQGIAVLMSNSLMFQSFPNHAGYEDPELSNFYGLAMPLVKNGIPLSIVHAENLKYENALKDVKVLLVSYSNMKPMTEDVNERLAKWVKKGGVLIYCGRDDDPFQSVTEWWNTDGNSYSAPSDHLFELMGLEAGLPEGTYSYGKGTVRVLRRDPKEFVLEKDGHRELTAALSELYKEKAKAGDLILKNNFLLARGPYVIAAVMKESVSEEPLALEGCYVDLFDKDLPVVSKISLAPGEQGVWYDVSKADRTSPQIIATAGRAYDAAVGDRTYSFIVKAPSETVNSTRVLLPSKPKSVQTDGREILDETSWDEESQTCLFVFDNNPDGVAVKIEW